MAVCFKQWRLHGNARTLENLAALIGWPHFSHAKMKGHGRLQPSYSVRYACETTAHWGGGLNCMHAVCTSMRKCHNISESGKVENKNMLLTYTSSF